MSHPDPLALQAHFDGEVDAVAAAQIEQHVQQCESCRAQLLELDRARSSLREQLTDYRAPASLRAQLHRTLAREGGTRAARSWPGWSFWLGTLSGGAVATAAAAALALLVWIPRSSGLTDDLISAHVRALMSSHPIDVVSTDRHTVKPWFAGHADVSPAVADFDAEGYRLIGGRADYLAHQRAAVMVYQHGAHFIDVFSWAGGSNSVPAHVTRDGYHVACWRAMDLEYCAVSDTGWDELQALQKLLRQLITQDKAPDSP
jgi:anti-sigma factor RsiW